MKILSISELIAKARGKKVEEPDPLLVSVVSALFEDVVPHIPSISCGGCGIFAEELYILLKELGYSPELIVQSYIDRPSVELAIKNNESNIANTGLVHILVRVNGRCIDSLYHYLPTANPAEGCYFVHGLPLELLQVWNAEPSHWNKQFNRYNIPELKERFKKIKENILQKDLVV